ncbi:MAG: Crp/Fnr family transcriptional regulator [Candidatus Saccharimonadales bacterium]
MAEISFSSRPDLISTSDDLKKLFKAMPVVRRSKNQIVIYEGDDVKHFFYLKSGYVKVFNINDDGEERTLLILKPGDFFPLLKDPDRPGYISPYFYDAMTTSEIGSITQADFLDIASSNRQAAWALLRYTSEFSSQLTQRLAQIEIKTAEGKLENLLLYLKDVCGRPNRDGSYKLELKLTHQDLASLLGIARETVSREIQELVRRGLVKNESGYLIIPSKR